MATREIVCRLCTRTIAGGADEARIPKGAICRSCSRELDAEAGVGEYAEADLDVRRMFWHAKQHAHRMAPPVCAIVRTSEHEGAQPRFVSAEAYPKTGTNS